MAEQLAVDKVVRNGAAVDLDKRPVFLGEE
jgi:hypothetical protein